METGIIKCKKHNIDVSIDKKTGKLYCKKCRKNRLAREKNQVLRLLTGTSARQARLDMGL